MEWNAKTPSQWDWESIVMFTGKVSETPKKVQQTDGRIEGDKEIDNGSAHSSGGSGLSGSGLGHGSSPRSSISASMDSSSKGGMRISEFNLDAVQGFPKDFSKNKELPQVGDTGTSPTLGASIGSGESLIGLKLGKRTYFEDECAGSTIKTSSFSVVPASSASTAKRSNTSYQSTQNSRCQVEGCNLDLASAKDYHRRHRVCESHSKCPKVVVAGLERRFCQQCSRFHDLAEFDEKKRSCRKRLSDHNARRRKPQPESFQFNSSRLSSSFYDERQQMSLMLNRLPLVHARPAETPWGSTCSFKLTQTLPPLLRPENGGIDERLHLPNNELPNVTSTLHHDSDRLLPFKGTTAEVLTQGLEAPMTTSNLDATPDLRRALSLLSTDLWGSNNPEPTFLNPLMHVNNTPRMIHSVPPAFPLASSEHWQAEHQPSEARSHLLAPHNNGGSQFQEFQLFKAPYGSDFFYSNQMN